MRFRVGTALWAVVVGAACAPAAQAATFEGGCATQGTVTITPPSGFLLHTAAHHYDGKGQCSGTIDGQAVSSAPVTYVGGAPSGLHSCPLNSSTRGPAVLTFFPGTGQAKSIRVFQSTTGTGVIYTPIIKGATRGLAWGVLSLPFTAATLTACANNANGSAPITITFSTLTPLTG
jgi:hypothetical protein